MTWTMQFEEERETELGTVKAEYRIHFSTLMSTTIQKYERRRKLKGRGYEYDGWIEFDPDKKELPESVKEKMLKLLTEGAEII